MYIVYLYTLLVDDNIFCMFTTACTTCRKHFNKATSLLQKISDDTITVNITCLQQGTMFRYMKLLLCINGIQII